MYNYWQNWIPFLLKEASVAFKGTIHWLERNEIGLRVPLRAYGAFVVRFLFFMGVTSVSVFFFSSFLMSCACFYTCFFSLSWFQSPFFPPFSFYPVFLPCFPLCISTEPLSQDFILPVNIFSSSKSTVQRFGTSSSGWRPGWSENFNCNHLRPSAMLA